jgi:hypothetical protein
MCPVSLGFRTPLDPTIIWRYMPLSKFETFVQSSALWFAAASSFPDRFEGTKAAAEASARDRLWDRLGVSEEQRETIRGLTDWNRQFSFVNCWMMNTKESDLMWRAYAGANGVVIESTYGRLRSVLPDWIFIHEVEYIDYEKDRIIDGTPLHRSSTREKNLQMSERSEQWSTFFLSEMRGVLAPSLCPRAMQLRLTSADYSRGSSFRHSRPRIF